MLAPGTLVLMVVHSQVGCQRRAKGRRSIHIASRPSPPQGPFAKKPLDPSTYRYELSYALLKEQPGTLLEEYMSTLPMYTAGKGWILQDQI